MRIIKKLEDWVDTRLLDSKVNELEAQKTARQEKFRNFNIQRDKTIDDAVYLMVEDLSKKRKGA